MKYNIIALIGESGSGKDTIMHEVLYHFPDQFHEIISCTTRPIREGEKEGVNYFYFTPDEMHDKIINNEMFEFTKFNNWFYGTGKESVSNKMTNIGVFNPDGIRSLIKNKDVNLIIYRVNCDSKKRLERQLNREVHPDIDEIIRRYSTDKKDFNELEFNYFNIYNNDDADLYKSVQYIVDTSKVIFA